MKIPVNDSTLIKNVVFKIKIEFSHPKMLAFIGLFFLPFPFHTTSPRIQLFFQASLRNYSFDGDVSLHHEKIFFYFFPFPSHFDKFYFKKNKQVSDIVFNLTFRADIFPRCWKFTGFLRFHEELTIALILLNL